MRTTQLLSGMAAGLLAAALSSSPAAAVETILQNDGYINGGQAGFQAGFVEGEIAASRFLPTGTAPWRVNRVQLLFGGATSTQTITLHIWDDTAGTAAPGTELYFGDYQLIGSDAAMQEIDLIGNNVLVSGQFRVGIEFQHAGLPSVARDNDGNIQASKNFIYTPSVPGWFQSGLFGLTGDWIIRAGVEPAASGSVDAPDILSILDVRNDQGRQVRIRFARSGQDQAGAVTPIVNYEVLRRVNPLLKAAGVSSPAPGTSPSKLAGWDFVAAVPAHGESSYNIVVPTLADSTAGQGIRWTAFIVRAATIAPLTFFDSPADSGYSVDNLAPGAPAALVYSGGLLAWNPAPEPDFDFFTVYGSDVATLGPTATWLGYTTANGFAPSGGAYHYYLVTATDFAGNQGPPAVADLATAADGPIARRALALRASPNPFNPRTQIQFTLPSSAHVHLDIYRVDGRLVGTLVSDNLEAGQHQVSWDGTDARGQAVASGSYVARLDVDGAVVRVPMSLVR